MTIHKGIFYLRSYGKLRIHGWLKFGKLENHRLEATETAGLEIVGLENDERSIQPI